eukprot:6184602-Pleurochrysis_carterae.AAC.4
MALDVPSDLQYSLIEFIAHVNGEDYEAMPQVATARARADGRRTRERRRTANKLHTKKMLIAARVSMCKQKHSRLDEGISLPVGATGTHAFGLCSSATADWLLMRRTDAAAPTLAHRDAACATQDFVNLGFTPPDQLERVRNSNLTEGLSFVRARSRRGGSALLMHAAHTPRRDGTPSYECKEARPHTTRGEQRCTDVFST